MTKKAKPDFVPEAKQPYKIPHNWHWVQWGEVGTFTAGNAFKNEYQGFLEYKIPFYKVGSLKYSNAKGYIYDSSNTINEQLRAQLKASLIPSDSLIFAKIGEAIKLNRRSLNAIPCCIDNNLMAFVSEKCLYLYAYYWSMSIDLYNYAHATMVPSIRKSDLQAIPFPLPPLAEQQRIVERIESLFTKLDAAREKAQAVVDGFELRKAAILYRAFTGKLTGINSYATVPLSMIADEIRIGPFGSALHKDDYVSGKIPVINPKHIVDQNIVPDSKTSISEAKAKKLSAYILKQNDIILARRGTMGRSAPVTEKEDGWLCGTGSMIIRLKKGYDAVFYSQVLSSGTSVRYLEENAVASTMSNLNEKIIRDLPVPNFSAYEQEKILAIISDLLNGEYQVMESAQQVIDNIDAMKKAILGRAFRGELGANDPSEASPELAISVL